MQNTNRRNTRMKKFLHNKIILSIAFIAVVAIIVFAIRINNSADSGNVELVRYTADNMYDIRDLDTLEDLSEVIIKGVVRETENKPTTETFMGRTYSQVEITEVYAGDVTAGDTIKVTESYYYDTENGVEQLYVFNDYLPCIKDEEYIFFLRYSTDDTDEEYYITGIERGRFSPDPITQIDGRSISPSTHVLLEDTTAYGSLRQEVLDKYY